MSVDSFTQTLQDLKVMQGQLAHAFDKEVLGRYVATVAKLDVKMLGADGLSLEAGRLLLEILPSKEAHHLFLSAIFGSSHSMEGHTLSQMLNLLDKPEFCLTHSMYAHMTPMFKVISNYEVILDWMLKMPSSEEGYLKVLKEMIYKCIPQGKGSKPFSDTLVQAINVAYPDVASFEPIYNYIGQTSSALKAPGTLLRSPDTLLRDVTLIRKKESEGLADIQLMHFFKPSYTITPDMVAPLLADPSTEWAVLDIMTLAAFKPIRFVAMPLSESPSDAEKALWAFTRMRSSRIHDIVELDITVLAKCFQHHGAYVDVCHKALEGALGEKVAGKLICNMIEATMLLRGTRKLTAYPREYAEVVAQVLEPLSSPSHFEAIKGMRYELYSSVNSQAAMMEETAPAFWGLFSSFRGWKSPKVRDTFFASDLGL